ncbi:hypothetical protein PIB30_081508 [Stylosanthes scabra]|uniref:Aminotransferase-like plant mobile domain-containing protein n=1 Tax=Stylosanthes scabra TaxID=79078 RepID=A0ABU6UR63_9FABA|nr:hypothetical protein [Stylosanthes scabra]
MGLWTAVCPLIYFGSIEWHQVDRVIPQFGGVQNYPHRPLNIDFLHAKDGRGGDRWFPTTYQLWHGLWASRHEQTFVVEEAQDPGPSAEYLRWWYLAGKRYLAPADAFYREVLTRCQVAASQLHLNGRGFLRTFERVCLHFGFRPSWRIFLYTYQLHAPPPGNNLLFFRAYQGRRLFDAFEESIQEFKWHYFKVLPLPGTRPG